jgi:hypothetical protein
MKRAGTISMIVRIIVVFTLLIGSLTAVRGALAQGTTMFPTPNGRYYNSYRSGPYGSYGQGAGGAFSAGSPNMFNSGATLPAANAYDPSQWPNVYTNRPYGGQFYFRPMVGPAYDPFRNGR